MPQFHQSPMAVLGRLKDLTSGTTPQSDPFLYYLPYLIERKIITSVSFSTFIPFIEELRKPQASEIVRSALRVLNQLVSSEDGHLLPVSPDAFVGNVHFKWDELGMHKNAQSVITHVINKVVWRLNLGKK